MVKSRRPRHRWEDNTRMDHRKTGWGLDTSDSGQESVAGSCEHSNELLDYLGDY